MGLTQVSTDGVKNDAITKTKIPANQIEASELADNAVDTNAIANNAVTAGKLASGVQTTINNNADNRVITGSGTANTLNGQQNLTFNGSLLEIDQGTSDGTSFNLKNEELNCAFGVHGTGSSYPREAIISPSRMDSGSYPILRLAGQGGIKFAVDANTERMRIDSSGNVGIGETAPADNRMRVTSPHANCIVAKSTNGNGGYENFTGLASNGVKTSYITHNGRVGAAGGIIFGSDTAAANALDDYEEGTCSSIGITTASTSYVRKTGGTVYYTKIGRVVHLYGNFSCNEFANYFGGSTLQITGFPFTTSGYANSSDIMVAIWGGSYNWWEEGYPSISMSNNSTTHELYSHRTPGGSGLGQYAAVSGSNVGAGSAQFNFDLIYFTDA